MSEDRTEEVVYGDRGQVLRRQAFLDGKPDGDWTAWDEDGWIAERGSFQDGHLEGKLLRYDREGRVLAALPYRTGKLDGEALFYDAGRLQMKIGYHGGLQDGETVIFGENDLPTVRSLYRAGKLHGLSSWYRPDGSLMRTSEHLDGELDGETVEYDEKGKAAQRILYRRGKPAR